MTPLPLPRTSLSLSPLCYGTADWASYDFDHLRRLYTTFRAAGGNAFDSAHCYAFWTNNLGDPERLLGKLVRQYESNRSDVVVITKGGHVGMPPGYPRPDKYIAPELLAKDFAESLERLDLPYVDLYLLHRDELTTPAEEHLHALQDFVRKGQIKHIGVSNWLPERIEHANKVAAERGWAPFVINQAFHNLATMTDPTKGDPTTPFVTEAHLPWYRAHKFPMLAFSANANGFFSTGKSRWGNYDNPVSLARLGRCRAIAAARGFTPCQVALAFLLQHPFPCFPLFGTGKLDHLAETLAATRLELTPAELASLTAA